MAQSQSSWNPNAWHWEMKDYSQVAKDLIQELAEKKSIQGDSLLIEVQKVSKVEGDAELSTRKGKLIVHFDLTADFKLVISTKDNSTRKLVNLKVRELNPAQTDEFEIQNVKYTEATNDEKFKKAVKEVLNKQFREFIEQVCKDLKQKLTSYATPPKEQIEKIQKENTSPIKISERPTVDPKLSPKARVPIKIVKKEEKKPEEEKFKRDTQTVSSYYNAWSKFDCDDSDEEREQQAKQQRVKEREEQKERELAEKEKYNRELEEKKQKRLAELNGEGIPKDLFENQENVENVENIEKKNEEDEKIEEQLS